MKNIFKVEKLHRKIETGVLSHFEVSRIFTKDLNPEIIKNYFRKLL